MTSLDDTIRTMHDSDNSLGNLEDLIKHSNSDSESQQSCLYFLDKISINKSYVVTEYENEFFPGLLTNKRGKKDEVITITMCGPQGLNWKWPQEEDKI